MTGALGFIGYNIILKLIQNGYNVIGIDNINNYYDIKLKLGKLPLLGIKKKTLSKNLRYNSDLFPNFTFYKMDIKNKDLLDTIFLKYNFKNVIHLAAQAGVQYSIKNPSSYINNNILGFNNIIELSKKYKIDHFIYASSSSVYGERKNVPFKETDSVDNPISIYAASKKTNELIAHVYSYLHKLQTTGLRFFTVYGPWGRPDMAPFIFSKNILNNKKVTVYNKGNMLRDFTYIDDITNALLIILKSKPKKIYNLYNIGNSNPIKVIDFIKTIENIVNKKANINFENNRPGDVYRTFSDISKLKRDFKYSPGYNLKDGLNEFYKWYKKFHN